MMTRRLSRKIAAWLMVMAMVAGLVAVPAKEVEAAASEIELSFTAGSQTAAGDSKNHVEAVISVPSEYNTIDKLKNAGVTSLEVTFKITSAQTTGSLAAQAFINAYDNWLSKWVEVGSASDNTITSTVDLTQLTGSGDVWNFGLQILNVSSVTYEITSAKLILAGSSSGTTGGGTTDFGTSRDYSSGVNVTLSNQDTPTNDWSGFDMAITNNSGSTICDWIIVLQVPSGTASAFKCWNATFVADGDTIYMYPMQSGANAVIAQGALGADIPGGGFSGKYVDAGSIRVKAVYYNKGNSSKFDYSSGDTNDETGGTGGGGNSGSSATDTSTNKDLDVEYNYAKLLQESLYFYDANMCGDLEGTCGLSWRGNCHTYDKNVTTTINGVTYKVDVSGGFHDAGDHVKFGLPQGYAATMLGMSYYQFPDAYTSTGQTAHLQAITDYFCDYFKRCTVYDSSGKVVGFCYQVGDGNTDHGVWRAPEGQTMNRPAYFATSSNPATDEVSVAIAALAMNYINFGNAADLKTAEDLFTFVKNNSKACATNGASGFYDSTSYGDDYALAASALYVATKNTSYNSIYNEYKDNSGNGVNQYWVLDWANTGALACMLQKDTSKLAGITNAGKNCSTIDGFFNCVSDWGSCRYNSASGFVGLVYDKLTNTTTYDSWVVSQMNYMIGDNPNKRCYIVGYNENSSQYPHHRAASRSTDAKVTREDHYTLLGALVGGPGKNATYKDDQNDYYCNEVALDYNAGLVSALAGLYCTHKNDTTTYLSYAKKTTTNYSTTLASADELSAVGVTKYYGSSSGVSVESVTLDNEELTLYVGDTDTLTATVTPSGAATVTWKSSDSKVATVSNGKVTAVKEGTATITATAGGKSAACKVTVTAAPVAKLEAGPAGLTCTALEYGYTNPAAGLVNISNNGTAEASGVTAALESGSSFTITQMPSESISVGGKAAVGVTPKNGLSAGTYKDTLKVTYNSSLTLSVPVTLTVNKRAVTVTADNVFKTYGEENPALTYKVTSGAVVSGDSLNITCSTTASKTSDAGSYPVTVTLGSNPNYEITTQAGTLTVNKKPVASIVFPSAADIEVGQTLASSKFSGGDTVYGTFAWANPATAPARGTTNADVVLTLTTAAKKNYSFSGITGYNESAGTITQSVAVNVNRAGLPTIIFPTASAIQYGQTLSESVLTGGSTQYGTFTWVNGTENMTIIGTRSYDVVFKWNEESKSKYGILDSDEDATLTKKVTVKVEKADNTAIPQKAVLVNRTSGSITVQTVSGYEYSKDGKTWQDSNVFKGLSAFTGYTIYTRVKETDYYKASDKSTTPLSVYTLVADPYTIDVSKLSNANYVDALCTSSGMATVSYDTGTGVLTLTDSSKPYTITGSNSNVTVKTVAGSGQSITLNNTTIQNLDVTNTNNAVATITGTAKVIGSIIADNTSVTLRGSGTLNVETIKADNGTVNIEGGTVNAGTVTAKNINISGGTIMITGTITAANDVTITGSTVIAKGGISAENKVVISGNKTNVTATGSDGNPAISASDITITDASVTATGGNGASAISSTGSITMKNANVTADTTGDGSAPAIQAGEGDEYKITIDGGNVTGNSVDNMYSKNPVDSQGNIIATYKVSIMDEAANRNETKAINAGSSVTLQAAGKKGYKAGWKDQNGKTYADGAVVTIEDDCSFTVVYTKISVTSVKLSVPAVELEVGKTVTATVKVLPADAADTSVTWSSSNPAVAAVDSKGVITAKAKGTAVITVTSNDTKVSDSVTITVKEASKPEQGSTVETDVKASSILLKASVKGAASVPVKSTYKLAPKKSMTLKVSFAPENAVKEKVTFKSSNTKIAKVNSKGKITAGKKAGKATITVTSENGLKKTFKVQVMKKAVTKVKIKASKKTIKVKKTLQLKAITSPGKKNASNSVYWKSSNPKIATVSSTGKVKAIKKGKVKITAVATDGSGKKTTITIKVKK